MPQEVRLWEISQDDLLCEYTRTKLDLEARLEKWLADDISILSPDLMLIGTEVETAFGGFIDLLCLDRSGDLVILELKRDKTPREITAQILDYASWVSELSSDALEGIAAKELGSGTSLEDAYRQRFDDELPDSLNDSHRMLIVAAQIDPTSERIIRYLSSNYGVSINAVTFHYFKSGQRELLARVFLIDPDEVDYQTRTRASSKRRSNLTYDELEELAVDNGVEELYRTLVSGLESVFQKHTTRSSIGFTGALENRRRTIISLVPGDSSGDAGVRFQIYIERFKRLFDFSDEHAAAALPDDRQSWRFYEGADDDYSGYQGFFATPSDVDRFLEAVNAQKA